MRKLLIAAVVLAVLAVAADFVAARVFESRLATAVRDRDAGARGLDLGDRLVVQVRDFPFLPHLASGRFAAIDLAAEDARAEGIALEGVEVHLRGVTVPRQVLLGGGGGRVRVDEADGRAELAEAEINRLLRDRLRGGSLEVEADGVRLRARVTILGRTVDARLAGRLAVRGNGHRVAFAAETVTIDGVRDPLLQDRLAALFNFEVPLPELPAGIRVERVDTQPGRVVLTGTARGVEVAA